MTIAIHGHRGSRGTHPENIIPSFAEAWSAGAPWVELDVHLTRDGHLVVYHDLELSGRLCREPDGRPLERKLPIAELRLEDIRRYDVGGTRLPQFPEQMLMPGSHVPTLEELILWKKTSAPALRLNVEIKAGSASPGKLAEATVSLLRKHGLLAESLVQSFDLDIVCAARALDDELRLSCLFERSVDFAREATRLRAQVVAAHFLLINADVAASCAKAGLELLPWTANDVAQWDRLIALGCRSIITDYPRKLAGHLAKTR